MRVPVVIEGFLKPFPERFDLEVVKDVNWCAGPPCKFKIRGAQIRNVHLIFPRAEEKMTKFFQPIYQKDIENDHMTVVCYWVSAICFFNPTTVLRYISGFDCYVYQFKNCLLKTS